MKISFLLQALLVFVVVASAIPFSMVEAQARPGGVGDPIFVACTTVFGSDRPQSCCQAYSNVSQCDGPANFPSGAVNAFTACVNAGGFSQCRADLIAAINASPSPASPATPAPTNPASPATPPTASPASPATPPTASPASPATPATPPTSPPISFQSPLNPNISSIPDLLATLLNILIIILTPIVVVFIILAGFKYVTAQGDATKTEEAKRALVYAIIGGVLIIGAAAITEIIANTINAFSNTP